MAISAFETWLPKVAIGDHRNKANVGPRIYESKSARAFVSCLQYGIIAVEVQEN